MLGRRHKAENAKGVEQEMRTIMFVLYARDPYFGEASGRAPCGVQAQQDAKINVDVSNSPAVVQDLCAGSLLTLSPSRCQTRELRSPDPRKLNRSEDLQA